MIANLWLLFLLFAKVGVWCGFAPGLAILVLAEFPYLYRWNRMGRKGQPCKVLVRGKMNSCLIEFPDGHQAVTSRNALRKRA